MRQLTVTFALAIVFASALPAAYSNLIATSDGSAVYFQVKTSFVKDSWFSARIGTSGVIVEPVSDTIPVTGPPTPASLADVNPSGEVFASASYGERYCGFGGSTCT